MRGEDVTAWIEVSTAEYGWVTLDPVPEERPIPEEEPEDPTQVARPQSIVPPPPDRTDANQDQSTPDSEQEEPDALDPVLLAILGVLRVAGLVLAVAGVLMAPFLFIIAAKVRRRRLRRTAPDTLQRIRGGWDEFADAVIDHGYSPPAAATRSELAAVVGTLPVARAGRRGRPRRLLAGLPAARRRRPRLGRGGRAQSRPGRQCEPPSARESTRFTAFARWV